MNRRGFIFGLLSLPLVRFAKRIPFASGVRVNPSTIGKAVPLVYGQSRVEPNLMLVGDELGVRFNREEIARIFRVPPEAVGEIWVSESSKPVGTLS